MTPLPRAGLAALLASACGAPLPVSATPKPITCPPPAPGVLTPPRIRQIVDDVALCRTSVCELDAQLGEPLRDGRLGGYRVRSWILGKEPERVLAVLVDGGGRIVDLFWDAPGVVSWEPSDHCRR